MFSSTPGLSPLEVIRSLICANHKYLQTLSSVSWMAKLPHLGTAALGVAVGPNMQGIMAVISAALGLWLEQRPAVVTGDQSDSSQSRI